MKKTATTIITLAIILCLTGCGARSVGDGPGNDNSNNNSNTNQNNSNQNNNHDFLTRATMYHNVANEVMWHMGNEGPGCPTIYEDIDPVEDEYLCWDLVFLHDLDVDTSSEEPNKFLPDQIVTRHEMWQAVTRMIGFMAYEAQCSFMIAEEHRPFLGALCDKGLLAEYEPDELVTLEEWSETLGHLRQYMQAPAKHARTLEVLIQLFVGTPTIYQNECVSQFLDVMDNTFACTVSNRAIELGLIVGYPNGTFQPDTDINWGEVLKLFIYFTPIDEEETGCYEEECSAGEYWYCQYVDPFCERGLLPETMEGAGYGLQYIELYRLAYDVYMDIH